MKSLKCQNCLSIQYSHFQTSLKLGNIVSFSYIQFFITSEDGVFNHSIRNIGRALTVSTSCKYNLHICIVGVAAAGKRCLLKSIEITRY